MPSHTPQERRKRGLRSKAAVLSPQLVPAGRPPKKRKMKKLGSK